MADSLNNNLVRDCQHRDRKSEEEVFQDVASRMAHELYSSSHLPPRVVSSGCLCKKTSSEQPTFNTAVSSTSAGVTRRMRPAENKAAVVVVELEDVTAAKMTAAGKIEADTVEAKAVTAMADATAEAEEATEDMTMSKYAMEESV